MNRRFIALALAFLLGFAQHAALAHGIGHHSPASHGGEPDRHHGASAQVAHAHDRHAPPGAPEGVHANCALDALYVEVLGGASAGAVSSLPYGALRESITSDDFLSALPAVVLAAAPRGPPAATLPQ